MNKERKSFIIHIDTLNVLDELTNDQKASLFDAIRDYQLGKEVKLSGLMKAVFVSFENQFKRDEERYNATTERNRENGKKGGRPKEQEPKKPSGLSGLLKEPKKADSDSDSDSKSDNDNDNDSGISAPAPKKIDWKEKREQRKKEFYESLAPFIGTYTKEMLRDFYEYWTEHGENDRLVKHEKKDSFSVSRRLANWHRNDFNKQSEDNQPRRKPKNIEDL